MPLIGVNIVPTFFYDILVNIYSEWVKTYLKAITPEKTIMILDKYKHLISPWLRDVPNLGHIWIRCSIKKNVDNKANVE